MMNIDNRPNSEQLPPIINYDDYRLICDAESLAYRPVGIIDSDKYERATADARTVYVPGENGNIPALAPIEYSDGYDIERVYSLTGSHNIYLLTVPQELITEELSIDGDCVVLVESADITDEQAKSELIDKISKANGQVNVYEFDDPRIEAADKKHASMGLYAGKSKNIVEPDNRCHGDIKKAFEVSEQELTPDTGLTLFSKDDFENLPMYQDMLWDLFRDRFEWLGDYHPVSMEDEREVFDKIILSKDTYVPMKFVDGELICAGVIMHNPAEIDWLSDATVERLKNIAGVDHKPMYFFGIVSKESVEALGNMQEVVQLHSKLAAAAGIEYLITFESTNMSSQYIPRITRQYIDSSEGSRMEDDFEKIAEVRYWFVA